MNVYRVMKWAIRDWRVMQSVGFGRSVTVSIHTTKQGARAALRKLATCIVPETERGPRAGEGDAVMKAVMTLSEASRIKACTIASIKLALERGAIHGTRGTRVHPASGQAYWSAVANDAAFKMWKLRGGKHGKGTIRRQAAKTSNSPNP